MHKEQGTFADTVTSRVLGVRDLLDRVTPDSELARAQWRSPRVYGPTDHNAYQSAQAADLIVESWWVKSSAHERVRRELAQMPLDVTRTLTKLELHETLGETELFVLKRLLFHAYNLCDIAAGALDVDRDAASSFDTLAQLLEDLHPEKEPSPRFHLSDQLDRKLADARHTQTRAKRAFMQRRKVLVELRQPDYPGARFNLSAEVVLSGDLATKAATDPGMQPHGNTWRIKDDELDSARQLVTRAGELVEQLESDLRQRLSAAFHAHVSWLEKLTDDITQLDLRITRIRLKQSMEGCWPDARTEPDASMTLHKGKDPWIDDAQQVDFDMHQLPALITGPNMGGKSSLLRLLGLCQWCLQHGLPAPARSYEAPLIRHIIYVGSDEIHDDGRQHAAEGLSSFGREIRRLVQTRSSTAPVTLWLLDEVGRGTHPDDGASLAGEILSKLIARGDRVFFATHFPSLAQRKDVQRWRIAGLIARDKLEELAQNETIEDLDRLEAALRESMDYRPIRLNDMEDAVPRDAHLIARLLGW